MAPILAGPEEAERRALALWYPDETAWPRDTPLLARLAEMSARAAAGEEVEYGWRMLRDSLTPGWERSLVELVACQWRFAFRRGEAGRLETALMALSPWMAGPDYLRRLREAALLRWLPAAPSAPRAASGWPLRQLLREAALIALIEEEVDGRRLPGRAGGGPLPDPAVGSSPG